MWALLAFPVHFFRFNPRFGVRRIKLKSVSWALQLCTWHFFHRLRQSLVSTFGFQYPFDVCMDRSSANCSNFRVGMLYCNSNFFQKRYAQYEYFTGDSCLPSSTWFLRVFKYQPKLMLWSTCYMRYAHYLLCISSTVFRNTCLFRWPVPALPLEFCHIPCMSYTSQVIETHRKPIDFGVWCRPLTSSTPPSVHRSEHEIVTEEICFTSASVQCRTMYGMSG